jgi:hypothetical protein
MTNDAYDPHSPNAMFSRIIERMDQQASEARTYREETKREAREYREEVKLTLAEIKTQTTLTNGRVTKIERWIAAFKTKTGMVVFFGSGLVSVVWWFATNVWFK